MRSDIERNRRRDGRFGTQVRSEPDPANAGLELPDPDYTKPFMQEPYSGHVFRDQQIPTRIERWEAGSGSATSAAEAVYSGRSKPDPDYTKPSIQEPYSGHVFRDQTPDAPKLSRWVRRKP